MKTVVTIFLITLLFFSLSTSSYANNNLSEIYAQLNLTEEETDFIKNSSTFTYGVTTDYAPIEYIDSSGTPKGFGIEYLHYASKLLGVKFVPVEGYKTLSWSSCYKKLVDNEIDIIPAITYTEKRNRQVLFTQPYLELSCVVIGNVKGRIILNEKDLADHTLAFPTSYWQNDYIRRLFPGASIMNTKDIHTTLKLIDRGRADYTFLESTVYNYYHERYNYKNLGMVGEFSKVIDQRMAVSKSNVLLLSILDKVIAHAPKEEIYRNAIYIEFIPKSYNLLIGVLILATLLLITLSYILYKKFKQSQLREKYLLRTREQLFESLAHDLKNPMCMVKANLDLIKYNVINPNELKDHLKLIYGNIDTINSIVDDLYELTSFKESILSKDFIEIKIGKFLQEIYTGIRPMFANANKELELLHDRETYHTMLKVEPVSFKRAIDNLLSNAYKYTHEEGKIKIRYYSDKNHLYLSVWDNGVGIPEKESDSIFNKFYRINNTHTQNTTGKGIGLSVVQEVIKLHGGNIHVNSIEGVETEFIIQISKT
ncbi:MAG: transporter substrate-binding domain-containing protein [Clostridia bacterium]